MKSRVLLNLALLGVIAVLGLVVWLKPGKKEAETTPLATVDIQSVNRVTLRNKDTLVFEKQDGAWRLTAPFAAPVNPYRVGQLLDIPKSASEARYPVKPEDLAQFGLNQPEATLTLCDTVMQFGGTDPINLRRYVKLGDTLHLVEDNFFHHLTAPATDYVEKKLLPDGAKPKSIELPGLKATKGAEGKWTAEPAGDGKSDLGELASTWATARAIEVKRNTEPVTGETIRIGLAEGEPIEFIIIKKTPELVLVRKDWGLQYEMTSDVSMDLLNQRPPPPPPPTPPAKPDAAKGEAGKSPHLDNKGDDVTDGAEGRDDDHDEESMESESGEDEHGH